jgi:hypothetical protein
VQLPDAILLAEGVDEEDDGNRSAPKGSPRSCPVGSTSPLRVVRKALVLLPPLTEPSVQQAPQLRGAPVGPSTRTPRPHRGLGRRAALVLLRQLCPASGRAARGLGAAVA